MSQASTARARWVRGIGWSVALPIASFIGLVIAFASGHRTWGMTVGSLVSLFGLLILMIGYSLPEPSIAGAYWMVPTAFSSLPFALLTYVFGHGQQWMWAIGWVGAFILIYAFVVAMGRHSRGDGGLGSLVVIFVEALIPGRHESPARY